MKNFSEIELPELSAADVGDFAAGGSQAVDKLKPYAVSNFQGVLDMHLETRVIVTDGAGFLGSHLCESLRKNGANFIYVDNFFTGTRSHDRPI